MKATGIVRRIDDLGRVVIPKEIRRTMRIREGTPLEIYTGVGGEVIFKKYSPVGELSAFAEDYAEALAKGSSLTAAICDEDTVIAAAGPLKKELSGKEISWVDTTLAGRADKTTILSATEMASLMSWVIRSAVFFSLRMMEYTSSQTDSLVW